LVREKTDKAEKYSETKFPLGLAWLGAFVPMAAVWFAGLEVVWSVSVLYAWVLAFTGSWVGLGLGLFLHRRSKR